MAYKAHYTESEMRRMQQDALDRVREMQRRAQQSVEAINDGAPQVPQGYNGRNYRNWNAGPNARRSTVREEVPVREERPPVPPEPEANAGVPAPPEAEKKTTLLQDILGAVGLDDDRLLIIGLLFILINAKADTTLILALIYLLI